MSKLVRDYIHDNNMLVAHLDRSLLSHLYKDKVNKAKLLEYRELFMQKFPDHVPGSPEFYALTKFLQKHFVVNFFDFFLFLTDAHKVQPIFRDIVAFHKHGPEALPAHMLNSGTFSWSANHNIELSLVVRGIGKSVFLMASAVHNLAKNIHDKSLVIQDKQDQSKRSVSLLKAMVTNPILALVFPHIFKATPKEYTEIGGIMRSGELNLKPSPFLYADSMDPGIFKKESSYAASSPQTSEVGVHVSAVFFDDLVNMLTPNSPAEAQGMIEYFMALDGLEEYSQEENARGIMYKGVGTCWRGPGLYEHIADEMNSSVFQLPIEYKYKEKQYYIAPIFNEDKVKEKVRSLGIWADSQLYMKTRDWSNETVDLGFEESRHVLTIQDRELATFKRLGVVTQACDPSYSVKNKVDGDAKSRFTILHTIVTEDTMYIFDVYSSKGERTDPTLSLNRDQAIEHKTDVFIMDAQGTQESLFKDVRDELWRNHDSTITCTPYKKGSNFRGLTGKAEIANGVLRSLIIEGKLKVLVTDNNRDRIQLVIDQLSGKDGGFDVIDCVVMTKVSVDVDVEMRRARARSGQSANLSKCLKSKKHTHNPVPKHNPKENLQHLLRR